MKKYSEKNFSGERALFASSDIEIDSCTFADGESPLKESSNIKLFNSMFKWKYPLWYCNGISAENCYWFEGARAGVWYSNDVSIKSSIVYAPKNFRRCERLSISDTAIPNASETLWQCKDVTLKNVTAHGDYFSMNCDGMRVSGLELTGNYSFDGARNLKLDHCRLLSKDAFWNSENVTVTDSFISGEYLGWNAKNLTLINCTVESLQGMCYIDNLVMKNCKLLNTTLAFEYSSVDADISSKIDSVLNPSSGIIKADSIGELIMEKDRVDPEKTVIICKE